MSIKTSKDVVDSVPPPLSMRELVQVLVKHYGLATGKYDLGIEFQIGTGPVGPNKDELTPGVIFGVKSIGLARSKGDGPTTVDAATLSDAQEAVPGAKPVAPTRRVKIRKSEG